MPAPDLSTLINGVKPNGLLTLDPPRKEFQGPIVIRQPMTIHGQGSTIWAERGPVVVIESAGVTLKDLNIEVTGSEDKLGEDQKCALIARSGAVKLDQVGVRGDVDGVPGEDRGWKYPRILRLNKLKSGQEHQFRLRLIVPVACRIESAIVGVELSPRDLTPGSNEILMKVERLTEGIRLRGTLKLVAGPVNRRIELSGHITSQGAGVGSGMGQIIYEAPDAPSSVPASAGGTVVIPAPPSAPITPTTSGTTVMVPPAPPTPVAVTPPPPAPTVPPVPIPTPMATSPSSSRPLSKMRKTGSLSSMFGPPPEKVPEPEPEPEPIPPPVPEPVAETPPAPPEEPPSTPLKKKSSMRRTDGLGGLFGG
jgi:hypothetical protein